MSASANVRVTRPGAVIGSAVSRFTISATEAPANADYEQGDVVQTSVSYRSQSTNRASSALDLVLNHLSGS